MNKFETTDYISKYGLTSVDISKDNKFLLISVLNNEITFIDTNNGELLKSYCDIGEKYVNKEFRLSSVFGVGDQLSLDILR